MARGQHKNDIVAPDAGNLGPPWLRSQLMRMLLSHLELHLICSRSHSFVTASQRIRQQLQNFQHVEKSGRKYLSRIESQRVRRIATVSQPIFSQIHVDSIAKYGESTATHDKSASKSKNLTQKRKVIVAISVMNYDKKTHVRDHSTE